MASLKVPVQIDYSVGQQDFLDIVDNMSAGDVEYTVAVRDPSGMPLYRFSSIQVVDKTSLAVMLAQQMAKDPHCHRPSQRSHRMFTVMEPLSCGQTGIGHGVSGVGFCRF